MACSKMLYRVVQNLQTDKHQNRAGNRNGVQSRTCSQADGGSNPQTRSSGESSDYMFLENNRSCSDKTNTANHL